MNPRETKDEAAARLAELEGLAEYVPAPVVAARTLEIAAGFFAGGRTPAEAYPNLTRVFLELTHPPYEITVPDPAGPDRPDLTARPAPPDTIPEPPPPAVAEPAEPEPAPAVVQPAPSEKYCSECAARRPKADFGADGRTADGLRKNCYRHAQRGRTPAVPALGAPRRGGSGGAARRAGADPTAAEAQGHIDAEEKGRVPGWRPRPGDKNRYCASGRRCVHYAPPFGPPKVIGTKDERVDPKLRWCPDCRRRAGLPA